MLYVVATPIGNLGDMSARAIDVLKQVDFVAAEDTRNSKHLFAQFNIKTPLVSYHDFSADKKTQTLLERLSAGETMALISDAGTPLISDPGFQLVRQAKAQGIQVVPVPGVSAITAALSVSGVACERFVFEGFLPAKSSARSKRLQELKNETRAVVFYEAPHRLLACIKDMLEVVGEQREVCLAREMTKRFETYELTTLPELISFVENDANQQKGECVLVLAGADEQEAVLDAEVIKMARIIESELPAKKAAALTAKITGLKKRDIYAELVK